MRTVICLDKTCCLVIDHQNGEPVRFGEHVEVDDKSIDLWC